MRINNLNDLDFGAKLNDIKIFVFDLDGVLLRNKEDSGKLFRKMKKFCSAQKEINRFVGIITAGIISELTNSISEIENCFVISSSLNKETVMNEKLKEMKMNFSNLFYMGDDMLDIPLLQKAGISCAPSNARREVKRSVDIILDNDESLCVLDTILQLSEKTEKE